MNRRVVFLLIAVATLSLSGCGKSQTPKEGVNYYLDSENGDDANNGLSEETAWRSIDKIRDVRLKAGDSLLFHRGSVFSGIFEIEAQGRSDCRIVIDAYGTGKKPCITAPDGSLYAVCIRNSDYVTLQNIEIINKGTERLARRTGVKVVCENYGTSHNVILNALDIHDVNGSLVKNEGGGSGILVYNRWDKDSVISVFDSLAIENCAIRRCERNAIIWSAPWSRKNWHLSTNTVVRKNLMRDCTDLLPVDQAAAGIWPWSCDNTVIQFNEVSDHKAPWDAQGFDSDYNCTNTTIQYNYSHHNEGGFILICNAGKGETNPEDNIGNKGTVVQYNVSISDAVRTRKTRVGVFSPTIHIAGPCEDTHVHHNILHANVKPTRHIDRKMVTADSWGGYADNTTFTENVFYVPEPSAFNLTKSTRNTFDGNYYLGSFAGKPEDKQGHDTSDYYSSLLEKYPEGFGALSHLFEEVEIADGAATIKAVKKEAIHDFFEKMKQ